MVLLAQLTRYKHHATQPHAASSQQPSLLIDACVPRPLGLRKETALSFALVRPTRKEAAEVTVHTKVAADLAPTATK